MGFKRPVPSDNYCNVDAATMCDAEQTFKCRGKAEYDKLRLYNKLWNCRTKLQN